MSFLVILHYLMLRALDELTRVSRSNAE